MTRKLNSKKKNSSSKKLQKNTDLTSGIKIDTSKFYEYSSEAIFIINSIGVICYSNANEVFFAEKQHNSIIGKQLSTYVNETYPTEIVSAIHTILSKKDTEVLLSSNWKVKADEHFPVQIRFYPYKNNRLVKQVLCYVREICTEKKLEAELLGTENRLLTLFENSSDMLSIMNERGILVFKTKACERILGIPLFDFLGKPMTDFVVPSDKPLILNAIEMVKRYPEKESRIEYRYQKSDGGVCFVEAIFVNQLLHSHIHGIVVNARDISERVLSDIERKKSETTFHLAFRQSPDAIYISRVSDASCIDVNHQFTLVTGYERDEVLHRSLFDFRLFVENNQMQQLFQDLIEDSQVVHIETNLRLKNGTIIPISLSADVCEINGEPCLICTLRDISELVRTRQEHEQFLERLRHINKIESLGVLAGGIAHDFNNLLAGILGFAELAEFFIEKDSPIHDYLQKIQEAGKRAAFLSNQMLLYTGQSVAELTKLNLIDVLQKGMEQIQVSLGTNTRLDYQFVDQDCFILGDELLLRQLLQHLITNADESLSFYGGKILVSIEKGYYSATDRQYNYFHEFLAEGNIIKLSVQDTGCGMDDDTLLKIFDPFYTTKFTGRGLGLSAVAGISRTHRAAIQVESQPGVGSTFRILFPALT